MLLNKGYGQARWNDFGGGINVRSSADSIDDKQCVLCNNFVSEGNKVVTIPGYSAYITLGSGVTKGQSIALYSGKILTIHNRNLYIYDTTSGVTYTKTNAVANASDTYSILTNKSFASGNISIVIINTNINTVEPVTGYEFDGTTFTSVGDVGSDPKWISLPSADRNFKCGLFFEGKLMLAGNPKYPSSLYTSKTGSVLNPHHIYDFGGYDSSSQNIGDGEPIVNITTNHNELFVFKTNSIWRYNGTNDTGTSISLVFKQETATGALNSRCVVPVEQDVIYYDGVNLRRLSYEININSLNDDSISKEINPILDSLPDNQSINATMYYVYPFVKLSLRDKFSQDNSVAICYNVVDKSYSTQSGINVVQGVGGFVNNKRTAYFVSNQGSTIYQDNSDYLFNGGNIAASFKSKMYVLGDGVDYKRLAQTKLYGLITPGLKVYFDVYVHGKLIDTIEIYKEDVLLPTTGSSLLGTTMVGGGSEDETIEMQEFRIKKDYFSDGKSFSFGLRSNGQGKFELHGVGIVWKKIKGFDIR